jgi:nucleotide-binding universal stress UspA family protein
LASWFAADLVLLHVLVHFYFPPPEAVAPVFGMKIQDQNELWAEARAEAKKYLNGKAEQLRADGLARTSCLVIDGGAEGAAADIIDLAAKTPEHLVVMSTHGRSGVARWLLGSVVERVVRHSRGAVLVIRPQR